ncbi:VWA domain-containing protein [Paenibacillus sp. LMG 31456]|uniref:VWA domain-containing protein n=1 Tax=Paenibacillus foliorum TaxID=2654974 RepID=A0A972GPL1_9BACL|nr:S-layer homology domain-containing protein [Paenibacillus foliorum]NOU93815.1 VWA domain-containing protein [Paenibacillus foliorum]
MQLKKTITSALICCLSFSTSLSAAWGAEAAPNTFADLSGHWSKADVEYLVGKGIIDGVEVNGQRLIMPDKSITRAEYIKILVGALGSKSTDTQTDSFKDVSAAHWAYKYIETAKKGGLVDGYEDGSFKPDSQISRAELATLLVRGYQLKELKESAVAFADLSADFWAFGAIKTAASNKLIEGILENGQILFKPSVAATRAESVTVIARYLKSQEGYALVPKETPEITPEPNEAGNTGNASGGTTSRRNDNRNYGIEVNLSGADLIASIGKGSPIKNTDGQGNTLELTGLNLAGFKGSSSDIKIEMELPENTFKLSNTVVPGVTGPVIEFSTNGYSFTNATLSFDVGSIASKANLIAAYYNEVTHKFEFLNSTYNAADDTLSFSTNHNSKYVLIDKLGWEQAWKNSLSVTSGVYKPYIDYAFIIDSSGSMTSTDPQNLRKKAVTDLVYKLNHNPSSPLVPESITVADVVYGNIVHNNHVYSESDRAAIIDFDNSARLVSTFSADGATVASAVYNIDSSGGTHIFSGLKLAFDEFNRNGDADNRWIAVLLTDGQDGSNVPPDWNMIQTAYGKGVTLVTMGLSGSVDKVYLEKMALLGGGQYFHVQTSAELESSFKTVVETTRHNEFIDADGDGIDDYYEVTGMLLENGMLVKTSIDPASGKDTDNDGASDGEEMGQPVDVIITADMVPSGSELIGKTVKMFKNIKSMPTDATDKP